MIKYGIIFLIVLNSCFAKSVVEENTTNAKVTETVNFDSNEYSKAYFASGCFWCVEAVYESVNGVKEVYSGYSGGHLKNPTYQLIGTGRTGHAEAVEIIYDKNVVSFETLVEVFFGSGNPTTPNQQGPDKGSQYRSIIFYTNAIEKQIAKKVIEKLEKENVFNRPIITEVMAFEKFWIAEKYHQNFEKLNPTHPYVKAVSIPRLNKFKAKFPELLK